MPPPRKLPDCWGHRGASAAYPENTLASFAAAIADGAEGIESDVHVSRDGVVLMFHDPDLARTTDQTGAIRDRDWAGPGGMAHARTRGEPRQAIPTLAEALALLMLPENRHVVFNVDVKVQNDPARLFALMHAAIAAHAEWETALAPRIVLGLWHPRFLGPAKTLLPYCRRAHIGLSVALARRYFWAECGAFSLAFAALATGDGQRFIGECRAAGKGVMVWTVNAPEQMVEAARWGVDVVLTDVTRTWLDLRAALQADYEKTGAQHGRYFLWTSPRYYMPFQYAREMLVHWYLQSVAGPFDEPAAEKVEAAPAAAVAAGA